MSGKFSEEALAQAVIQNVEHGDYPESEDVVSAELPASAYPKLLDSIEHARDEIKAQVRALSRKAGPNVDSWITQARQLQADIERSKITAAEIVKDAEAGKELQASAEDASNKVRLLKTELAFNESLAGTLNQVKAITGRLDGVLTALAHEKLLEAIDGLETAVEAAKELSRHENTRFTGLVHDRIARLGSEVRTHAVACWDRAVVIDKASRRITFQQQDKDKPVQGTSAAIDALARLNALDDTLDAFWNHFNTVIIRPILDPAPRSGPVALKIDGNAISVIAAQTRRLPVDALDDVRQLLDFVRAKLPEVAAFDLSQKMVPSISSRLIEHWLLPAVPLSIDGINDVEPLLQLVLELSERIRSFEWFGANVLSEWVEEAPRIWLSRRKEAALSAIRASSFRNLSSRTVVERVETQVVTRDTGAKVQEVANNQPEDDWDEPWDDGEETQEAAPEAQDEDASAWDVEDDVHPSSSRPTTSGGAAPDQEQGDGGDAWGWGDDNEEGAKSSSPVTKRITPTLPKTNGTVASEDFVQEEVTLKENYTVTGIPDALMALITSLISDAEELSGDRFASSPIAPAGKGLYSIPPLILGMYRATAATFYAKDVAGNMLLYNDCQRLTEQLTRLAADSAASGVGRLRLDSDIAHLEHLGKLAYGREMESQRTILRDLLDGAQSFTDCTVAPFAGECENAVAMTVDRVREVKKAWEGILSSSALLQSMGNLVATITSKVVIDIEEMTDISEDESKQLRKFCDSIAGLSDIFVQRPMDGSGEPVDMTGVYTPNWFKFQYLAEILDSRLADIKYLWQEGELSLEFEVGEVVDLIEALFADSEYRRNAIREIRASGGYS